MNKPVAPLLTPGTTYPIGIDFGTSNSTMSRYAHNLLKDGPETINFPITGHVLYPSFALIDDGQGIVLTGLSAYNKRFIEPEKVVASVKRRIKENTIYYIGGKSYSNVDIASFIFSDFIKEVKLTDPHLRPKVITVTVPYYFGENENVLIKQAATSAIKSQLGSGIEVFLLPEPIAASLACLYNLKNEAIVSKIFLVYDIGGGTLDITLLKITSTVTTFSYEVLANEGIARFGGDDIDILIYDYVIHQEKLDFSALTTHQKAVNKARLMSESVEAKRQLTSQTEYTFLCSNLIGVGNGCVELLITREVLESLISGQNGSDRNMLGEFTACIDRLYAKANINPVSVDVVIPVGGTSRIPLFGNIINDMHRNAKEYRAVSVLDHFTLVANGACVYAAMKSDELYGTSYHPFNSQNALKEFTTRIPHALYIRKYDGRLDLLIPANSKSPSKVTKVYYPSKLKEYKECVELTNVELFQAQGESRKFGNNIGVIDFSKYEIYTHGRCLKEIPISVTFEVTDTLIQIHCRIEKGTQDGCDIDFIQVIHYS